MTNEMDGPGFTGFGYGNQGGSEVKPDHDRVSQGQPAPSPEVEDKQPASSAEAPSGNGAGPNQDDDRAANVGAQADGQPELGEVVPLDFEPAGPAPALRPRPPIA